jgi:di/tricarboxylate transporter
MIPPVLVLYLFAFAVLEMGYRHYQSQEAGHQLTHAPTATRTDDHQHDRGSFSRDQRIVGSVLGGTVCLWVVGSFLGLPTIVPAAVSVFVLSIPPIGILTTEDVRQVNWGILFILGGMLSILEALQSTGALAYLTRVVTDALVLESFLPWQVVGGLLVLAAVIRLFFSTGSAALIVTIPIILQLAQQFQINTLYLTLALLLVIGSTALLPFHTTSTLVSFDEGPLSNRIVFVFGFVTMVGSFAVVALSWGLYWPLIAELLHLP